MTGTLNFAIMNEIFCTGLVPVPLYFWGLARSSCRCNSLAGIPLGVGGKRGNHEGSPSYTPPHTVARVEVRAFWARFSASVARRSGQ